MAADTGHTGPARAGGAVGKHGSRFRARRSLDPGRDTQRFAPAGAMRALAVLLIFAGWPAALSGQQRWERQVSERIRRAIDAVGTSSSSSVVKGSGMLNTEETAALQTTLVQG